MFSGSSEIPRFEHALDPDEDEKPKCLKPTILPDIVNKKKESVKNVVANQKKGNIFTRPGTYIKRFCSDIFSQSINFGIIFENFL